MNKEQLYGPSFLRSEQGNEERKPFRNFFCPFDPHPSLFSSFDQRDLSADPFPPSGSCTLVYSTRT